MSVIILPRRWERQPDTPVELDWSHWAMREARAVFVPWAMRNLVDDSLVTPLWGSEKIDSNSAGLGFYSGSNAKWDCSYRKLADSTWRKTTFAAVTTILSTSQQYSAILGDQATIANGLLTWASSNKLRFSLLGDFADEIALALNATQIVFGSGDREASGQTMGAQARHPDGLLASTTPAGSASSYNAGTYPLCIGGDSRPSYKTSRYTEQLLHLGFIAEEQWGSEQMDAFRAAPYAIFKRSARRVYFVAGSGASQDMAASGSAAATGAGQASADYALAAVGVVVANGTALARADVSVTAVGYALAGGAAAIDGSASADLSAAGAAQAGGSADLVASVTIGAADLATAAGSAGLSADVLQAGAGAAQAAGNAALAATLSALAAGAAQAGGSATLSGGAAGELDASGGATAGGAAALSIVAELVATGTAQSGGSAVIEGGAAGELAASGGSQAGGQAQARLEAGVTAAGFVQAMGAGYLVIQGALSAQGAAGAGGAAQLVNASALVLIKSPRFVVRASGRKFSVSAPGRSFKVSR